MAQILNFESKRITMKMKKQQLIIGAVAAGALAIGSVVAYFIKRSRNMQQADNMEGADLLAERNKPRKHITDIFRKAKTHHMNGHHEPALTM
jgi:hypothetical protein